jgi:Predicted metal-binding integral membrane protein (DUF2182)/Bacterial protein of unknown function (DUF899)
MTKHMTGTREEWLAARLELLEAEKELTRRSDELARRRQDLPWVRIDKEYRFETDEGSASLADLFRGRSQLLVYHFMFGPDYTAGCPSCSSIADGFAGFVMLPSLVPMLRRYRQAVGRTGETRLGRLTALVGVGYFFVWTVFGMAAFPLGVALAAIAMQQPALARAVPIAVGVVVLIAGSLQLTAWKARHLACCREAPGRGHTLPPAAGTAWRHGLRLGLHCSHCCAGLMAIPLVIGVMDLRAMAVVAAAITVERLAPAGERVARAIGAVVIGAGLFLIARAL